MILSNNQELAVYLQIDLDAVDIFIEEGLPLVDVAGWKVTTAKLVDQWVEEKYLQGKAPRSGQPVRVTTTGCPVQDLRAVVEHLHGEGFKKPAELLASLEHAVDELEADKRYGFKTRPSVARDIHTYSTS